MAKRKVKKNLEWTEADERRVLRQLNWERNVAEMRDGRRDRSVTFTDRRKEASRTACRKPKHGDWS